MKTSKELTAFLRNATHFSNLSKAYCHRYHRAEQKEYRAYLNGWREKDFGRREKRYLAKLKKMERNLHKQAANLWHHIEVGDSGEFFGHCAVSCVKVGRITVLYPDEKDSVPETMEPFYWLFYHHYNLSRNG